MEKVHLFFLCSYNILKCDQTFFILAHHIHVQSFSYTCGFLDYMDTKRKSVCMRKIGRITFFVHNIDEYERKKNKKLVFEDKSKYKSKWIVECISFSCRTPCHIFVQLCVQEHVLHVLVAIHIHIWLNFSIFNIS